MLNGFLFIQYGDQTHILLHCMYKNARFIMDTLVFVHGHGHGCNYSHRSSTFASQFPARHRLIVGRRQVSTSFLSLNFKIFGISNNFKTKSIQPFRQHVVVVHRSG